MVPVSQPQPKPPSEDESEEFVAAALKVDPQRLSGKHRKDDEKKEEHSSQAIPNGGDAVDR